VLTDGRILSAAIVPRRASTIGLLRSFTTAGPPPPPPPANQPPVADAGPDPTVRAASGGKATFTRDGTASSGYLTLLHLPDGHTSDKVADAVGR
jgi:hypothetical protein